MNVNRKWPFSITSTFIITHNNRIKLATKQPQTMKMKEQQSLSNWVLQPVDATEESKKSATTTAGTAIVHRTNATRFTYTFPSSLVNGIPHPGWISQANWELQRKLVKFRPSDIFITTFSKCGTFFSFSLTVAAIVLHNI